MEETGTPRSNRNFMDQRQMSTNIMNINALNTLSGKELYLSFVDTGQSKFFSIYDWLNNENHLGF
jgi:hypothetical protein